jgi:hypothetical protein
MTQFPTNPETAQNVGTITEEEKNLVYYHRGTEGLSSPEDSTKHGMALRFALSPQRMIPFPQIQKQHHNVAMKPKGENRKFIMHHITGDTKCIASSKPMVKQ